MTDRADSPKKVTTMRRLTVFNYVRGSERPALLEADKDSRVRQRERLAALRTCAVGKGLWRVKKLLICCAGRTAKGWGFRLHAGKGVLPDHLLRRPGRGRRRVRKILRAPGQTASLRPARDSCPPEQQAGTLLHL